MSATVTKFMVEQLKAMTGIFFEASNTFWLDAIGMHQ
jgi:hypothetical protein